jgi:hypothetical protein
VAGDNLLEWAFSGFPANQLTWSFTVSYPSGLSGNQVVTVPVAQYRSPTTDLIVASITLTRAVPPTPTAPSITNQPQSQAVRVGENVTFSVGANGTAPFSYQWRKNDSPIGGATNSSYTISSVQTGDAGNFTVDVTNGVGSARSNSASLTVDASPRVTTQPQSQTVNAGADVSFTVAVSGAAPFNYQWRKGGVAILGATSAGFAIRTAKTADAGTYTVDVWNSAGTVTSNGATLTVTPPTISTRMVNIATRAYATTGNGVAIGGFVISGNTEKEVLVRAVGSTLTKQGIGVAEVLKDPVLELRDASHGNALVGTNDNWGDNANAAAITTTGARVGATPIDQADTKSSALLVTLPPGVYTFVVSGKANSSGIVLLEVYDAD